MTSLCCSREREALKDTPSVLHSVPSPCGFFLFLLLRIIVVSRLTLPPAVFSINVAHCPLSTVANRYQVGWFIRSRPTDRPSPLPFPRCIPHKRWGTEAGRAHHHLSSSHRHYPDFIQRLCYPFFPLHVSVVLCCQEVGTAPIMPGMQGVMTASSRTVEGVQTGHFLFWFRLIGRALLHRGGSWLISKFNTRGKWILMKACMSRTCEVQTVDWKFE